MTNAEKMWIDNSSYEDLLRHWRFAPAGDPMFQGDTGQYYQKIMQEKKAMLGGGAAKASKTIGWEKP